MDILWIFLASTAGACIAVQAAVNGSLRMHLGDARHAAFLSICGTMLSAVIFMIAVRPGLPPAEGIRSAPWWNWIGGPLGALIVLSGAGLTPKMGSAAFIAAVVGGQLLCSLFLDHFGFMNVPQHAISLSRALGAAMVFGGVLLVTYR